MHADIIKYNDNLNSTEQEIAVLLSKEITEVLGDIAGNKVWHGHPVWFIEGNPIVGYAQRKDSVQLLFWSGQSFDEPNLKKEGSFKAAEVRYASAKEIDLESLRRWLKKSISIQWDYKNIVKRKGVLERIS